MAVKRKVKCKVTGEFGTSDVFFKNPDGPGYYKSKELYDEIRRQADARLELVDILARDLLDYDEGQKFPPMLTRKLKELDFYSNVVILDTIKQCYDTLLQVKRTKEFSSTQAWISYMFAIIGNRIPDVYKEHKKREQEKERLDKKSKEFEQLAEMINVANETHQKQKTKDISALLGE